ncbi:MAG TPA: hypothetical protein VH020_07000 [Stellaceae bacterium]|nr:hypothetical protein [Stellaceae bacterium]
MQRRDWMIAAAALIVVTPLTACVAQTPDPIYPVPRYADAPPFRFAVGALDIVDRDPPTLRPPRVEHLFPVPPSRALRAWARDAMVPVGGPDHLRFTIERADVIETPLRPRDRSLSDAATDQISDRYDATAAVRLEIVDPQGHAVASARAIATRFQTLLESTSPAQRDRIWYDMTRQLMAELIPELDQEIRAHLATYLR